MVVSMPAVTRADPRQQYFEAEACYRKLKKQPEKRKYRDNWMQCIDRFESVYTEDTDGPWAAAGLYMAGELRAELARYSGAGIDRQEARDAFSRVIRRFPDSRYRSRAEKALAALPAPRQSDTAGSPPPAVTDPAYQKAMAAFNALMKDARRQQYRHHWFRVLEKFKSVYRQRTEGTVAAASLFMTGRVYDELAKRSHLAADRREADDIYQRVIRRFPDSDYARQARQAIHKERLSSTSGHNGPRETLAAGGDRDGEARKRYLEAEKTYRRLQKHPGWKKYRDKWMDVIDGFMAVHAVDPDGSWAAAGLYRAAVSYQELSRHSFLRRDREAASRLLRRIVRQYPDSRYAQKASRLLGEKTADTAERTPPVKPDNVTPDDINQVIQSVMASTEAPSTPGDDDATAADASAGAIVTGLRYWSNPHYTRIVIDASDEMTFTDHLLKRDPDMNKPQRLYVDLSKAKLGDGVDSTIPINDNLLSDARAGQYDADTVRVVVDIKSFDTYKIFPLKNPFRVVIDVRGKVSGETAAATAAAPSTPAPSGRKLPDGALAKQLSLGVSRIVIDPGHGGKDYGAPGYLRGVHEKHIVLQIAKRLAKKIHKRLNCEVLMTRSTDKYLTLEERTAFANTRNADLFISIHTNAARDSRAYGIETFFLNLATDDDAIRVAAMENATSRKNISDLQTILSDLMQNAKINESSRLARVVQDSVTSGLSKRYSRIKNKGVKQAPFYVLLGAQMPSILIETSFISNKRECKRLTTASYQEHIVDGIVDGIAAYIKSIQPTAFKRPGTDGNG